MSSEHRNKMEKVVGNWGGPSQEKEVQRENKNVAFLSTEKKGWIGSNMRYERKAEVRPLYKSY